MEELAAETQMSIANTSQHLQRLKQSRLVASTREVREVGYPHLLDIDEVAIRMAKTADQAGDVATSLVGAKNAKEAIFNFAPSREPKP